MPRKFELQRSGPVRGWLAEVAAAQLERTLGHLRERLAVEAERARDLVDEASRLELRLLRKLEPVIDNLGELVRLELEEARARLGRAAGGAGAVGPGGTRSSGAAGSPDPSRPGPEVIDVEGRPVPKA
jgi:hypothetical protein